MNYSASVTFVKITSSHRNTLDSAATVSFKSFLSHQLFRDIVATQCKRSHDESAYAKALKKFHLGRCKTENCRGFTRGDFTICAMCTSSDRQRGLTPRRNQHQHHDRHDHRRRRSPSPRKRASARSRSRSERRSISRSRSRSHRRHRHHSRRNESGGKDKPKKNLIMHTPQRLRRETSGWTAEKEARRICVCHV
jgi:hypothetical protein